MTNERLMQRQIIFTADGSPTILITETGIAYHSKHGALAESMHVYMGAGLNPILGKFETINIFEVGFGTGLNAWLCFQESIKNNQKIFYETIDTIALNEIEIIQLNSYFKDEIFLKLHQLNWEEELKINRTFTLLKHRNNFEYFIPKQKFHLIFFDAFSPKDQPEMWTRSIFEKLFFMLLPHGVLVTYSSQSAARKKMAEAGFTIKKFKGIFGKRECVIATKNI